MAPKSMRPLKYLSRPQRLRFRKASVWGLLEDRSFFVFFWKLETIFSLLENVFFFFLKVLVWGRNNKTLLLGIEKYQMKDRLSVFCLKNF